jgi:hypothetical protein
MYQGAEGLGRMGEASQRMGYLDAAALEGIGAQQQGQDQRSLDLAYQDFLEQRQLPFDRLAFMNQLIRGLPMDTTQTRTDVGPASIYQPSPLSQIVGAYGVYRGLNDGNAEGGYIDGEWEEVPDYAEGGYAYPKAFAEGGYAQGGLAQFFNQYFPTFTRAATGVSNWARKLVKNPFESVGILGGKNLVQESDEMPSHWRPEKQQ